MRGQSTTVCPLRTGSAVQRVVGLFYALQGPGAVLTSQTIISDFDDISYHRLLPT